MRSKIRGFSLTEVLVTVALLGMFTGLTLSALGPLNQRYRRRHAAELVAAASARARSSARDSGRCHLIEVYQDDNPVALGSAGNRLRVTRYATADCESAPAAGDLQLVEWVPMPSPATVRVVSGAKVVWRPNGRLLDPGVPKKPARLWVTSGGEDMAILLAVHGPVCVTDDLSSEDCP